MARTLLQDKDFAWVDVETTGLDPARHEIIEICIVRHRGKHEELYEAKIMPERLEDAQPKALEINGFTKEAWVHARPAAEVFDEIVQRKLLDGAILAGLNVRFDARFIQATTKRLGLAVRFDYHTYDVATLALEHLVPHGITSVAGLNVAKWLGIINEKPHTARGDVKMTIAIDRALRRAGPLQHLWWRLTAKRRNARLNDH